MGIPGLDGELRKIPGCVINVSIADLREKYGKNVVVVDGFNFYGVYLYPKFDWVCGAIRDLVEEIRRFVEAFEHVGVKLVFFFVDGNLDEGADSCGSESWIKRRTEFIQYTNLLFSKTSQWKNTLDRIKNDRAYYHTPLNALPVVLFALRHIFKCEVHLVYAGDRNDAVAYYSRDNDCLGILAQDNYYIFYHQVPLYLSLKNLQLTEMTTVQYCPEELARHKNLEGHLYPIFIKNESLPSVIKKILIGIEADLDECESIEVARKTIEGWKKNKCEGLIKANHPVIEETLKLYTNIFLFELLRFKYGFDYLTVYGPLKEWDLIKLQAQEFAASGHMSRDIECIFMSKKYYNKCILEDFVELPPSSVVFQFLREKLYGVLLHEEPADVNESNDSEASDLLQPGALKIWERKLYCVYGHEEPHKSKVILELHMGQNGCISEPINVIPNHVNSTVHPGLLLLWNANNLTSNIGDQKWQLFASCISDNLQWQLLYSLPPTLVVPTVVLYYLFQVVPPKFKSRSWKFLKSWEAEVFIAQAVMLSKISANSLSQIKIKNVNPRVVKLTAFFVYGCHQVRLLIEACGYPISEHDLCLFNFFDGKLFHSFYDRAEWRRSAQNLCDKEFSTLFEKMKQIIIPETH